MFRRALLFGLFACGEPPQHANAVAEGAVPPPGSPAAAPAAAPAAPGMPEVVAEIGGKPVTWNELFDSAAPELIAAEMALNQARADALNGLVMQRLIEAEAAKVGKTPDLYVQGEVESKATPPSEAQIAEFYAQNQRQMQGASLEEVRPRIAQYLQQQQATEVLRALVTRLEDENGVKKMLPHYRLDVAPEDSPRKGAATAPIQIVEFSDFQCPYCSDAATTVKKVEEKYGDKVSIVYRHFPLPMHDKAHRAAEASQCANDQGQFWTFHDALFADQKPWTDDDFKGIAKTAGIDVKKFEDCLSAGTHVATVDEDMEDGRKAGMNGTPGFYINGIVLSGARPFEDFVDVIDEELAKGGT